jgi:hypothetical protein
MNAGVKKGPERIDLELVVDRRLGVGRQEDLEDVLLPERLVPASERRDHAGVPPVEPHEQRAGSPADAESRREAGPSPRHGVAEGDRGEVDQAIVWSKVRDVEDLYSFHCRMILNPR